MISPFEQSSFKKPSSVNRLISVGSGGPTKTAICIGINKYPPGYPSLTKCVDDAKAWQALLTSRGFKCTMLLDEAATKANIISTITSAISKNRKKGSIIVITNSSHGSQVWDADGDEMMDNFDEVLCPCDWPNYVSDDALRTLFQNLAPDVTLEVILDCCHSGTGSRDIGPVQNGVLAIRSLPPIIEDRSRKGATTKLRGFIEVPDLNHVLIAGCKDSEVSYELSFGGALTYFAIQAINLGYNRQQMIDYVQTKIAALGIIQTPQLECTQIKSTQLPFQ